ncbi:hypothetical protein Rhopal_006563-T1 [Rhodotorula paludigena]|uniref:Uncharacterized protein n=1 Tax=Rhodotorula paludigena TaxID=86838 RepID=A0AAV5GVJ2_9BASI|nr:hypothetical protein Rhopal_006563-T1 [Rhodotorula paludigena]
MATPSRAVQIVKFCKREIPGLTDPELSGLGHALLANQSRTGFKPAKNEESLNQHYRAVLAECEKRVKAVEKEAKKIPDMTLQNLSDLEELGAQVLSHTKARRLKE